MEQTLYIAENFVKMASGQEFDKELDFKDGVVFEKYKKLSSKTVLRNCGLEACH